MISFKKNRVDRAQLTNRSAQPTAGTHTARSWLFVLKGLWLQEDGRGDRDIPPLPATGSHNSSQRALGEGWQGMTHCWQKRTGLSHSPALKKPKPGQTAIQQDSWTLILPSFYFLPLLPLVWTANLPETLTQKRLLSSYPREKNNLKNKMWITSDSSAAVSPECSVILPAETQ